MKYNELEIGKWYVVPSGASLGDWILKVEKFDPTYKYPIASEYGELGKQGNYGMGHFSGDYMKSNYREATIEEIQRVFPNEKIEIDYEIF